MNGKHLSDSTQKDKLSFKTFPDDPSYDPYGRVLKTVLSTKTYQMGSRQSELVVFFAFAATRLEISVDST